MKLLLCSDAHVDATTAGFSRMGDVRTALWKALDAAVEESVDFFIFLGDLCDPDRGRAHESVALAIEVAAHLDRIEIPQWWLTGNHDVLEDGSRTSTLEPLAQALKSFARTSISRVVSEPCIVYVGHAATRLALIALPYVARAQSYDPVTCLEAMAKDVAEHDVRKVLIFSHLMLEGMQPGSETIDMSRGRDVFLPIDAIRAKWGDAVIFSGHYHRREVHRGIQIVGSLVNLTFGEQDNKPGYLIVEVT